MTTAPIVRAWRPVWASSFHWSLFDVCRPSAVARLVITVVVLALDAVLRRRTRTHVCVERGEILPSFADGDSSSSIPLIGRVRRRVASASHLVPDGVLGRPAQSVRLAPKFGYLAMKASAGSRESLPDVSIFDNLLRAALALAKNHASSRISSTGLGYHRETSECFPDNFGLLGLSGDARALPLKTSARLRGSVIDAVTPDELRGTARAAAFKVSPDTAPLGYPGWCQTHHLSLTKITTYYLQVSV